MTERFLADHTQFSAPIQNAMIQHPYEIRRHTLTRNSYGGKTISEETIYDSDEDKVFKLPFKTGTI